MTNHFTMSKTAQCVGALALFVLAEIWMPVHCARADFAAVGDVISSANGSGAAAVNEAGGATGDLIIGDTAVGGLLADGAAPFIGVLGPLESDSVILGNEAGSIGAANIEDFIPGGNWIISDDLVVGHAGQGFLDFLNAAGVQDAPSATVLGTIYVGGGNGQSGAANAPNLQGDPTLGLGIVRVNGLGSNLTTQELVVGGAGQGIIEASGRSQIFSQEEVFVGSIDNNLEGSFGDGTIRLTDLGTRWFASEAITVGGQAGSSVGKIEILNEAVLQVENVQAGSAGSLTINPRGTVDLAGGTIRMIPQAIGNIIVNDGLIRGDGFIDGRIEIGVTGELRNAATLANEREYLLVSEAVVSDGLIESEGGEMEFLQRVTSTGTVLARNAIMRFRGSDAGTGSPDLAINSGVLQVGGDTTIHGDVNIDAAAGASLFLIGGGGGVGGGVHFVDNLTFDPAPAAFPISALAASRDIGDSTQPSTMTLTVGQSTPLSIGGMLDLGSDLSLDVIYDALVPSQEGDVLTVLSAAGGVSGAFVNTQVFADGRVWDIGYDVNGSEVFITALASGIGLPGDLNADDELTGLDLLAWQRNQSLGNLGDWEANYGSTSAGPSSGVTAVPEPTTLVLSMLALVACPRRRVQS